MENSQVELAEVEALYRKTVRDAFESLSFKGLTPTGQPVSLPLEEVYVGLKLLAEVPEVVDDLSAAERRLLQDAEQQGRLEEEQDRELDGLRYRRWREEARGEQTRLQRRSLDATQVELEEPVMVLLGDPGSGKTTLLHYLALRAIGSEQAERKGRLPLFVPLAAYDEYLRRTDDTATLEQFLALHCTRWSHLSGLESLFHRALEEGRALVLLDGLDEVLELTTRRRVAQQVSDLLQKWEGRGNRFVLTSRFIGYREVRLPGRWPHYMVLDFGPEEIERFAHKWSEAFEVLAAGGERSPGVLQRARQEARALLADVHSKPGVEHLASNPLLLTMLAQLRRQEGQLPARRIELYARYVRMLLEHWAERIQPEVAHQHLMDLALWLQRHRPSGTARQSDLKALRHQEMRNIAGLLGERGHDAYGFLHLTFQEYFVGRALARESPESRWELLRPHLHDPRWHEPLLLCAGQLGVLEHREDEVDELVERILGAGSEHEEVLHRDLFLATAVLAEGVTRSKRMLSDMTTRLKALRTARVPSVRQHALAGMAQLMRLGHEPAKEVFLAWVNERPYEDEIIEAVKKLPHGAFPAEFRETLVSWAMSPKIRATAVGALRAMDDSDGYLRQALLSKLNDEDEESQVRSASAWTLGDIAGSDGAVRQALLSWFTDEGPHVRRAVAEALRAEAVNDGALRQVLRSRLTDENPHIRESATKALEDVVDSDEAVRKALLSRLTDEEPDVRELAAKTLGSVVGHDEAVRQALLARLTDEEPDVRDAAAKALGAVVGSDGAVRQALLALLDDEEFSVRRAAAKALGAAVGSDGAVRQALLAQLDDEDSSVREGVAEALATVAGSDEAVRQALLARLADEDPYVRRAAAEALGALVGCDEAVRQALLALLDDERSEVRGAVSGSLGAVVGSDEAVRQTLLSRLGGERQQVRSEAIRVMGALVGRDEAVRQAILSRLDDEDWEVRQAAAEALGAVAVSDGAVRQTLLSRLGGERQQVRSEAIRVIGALVGRDEAVRQVLLSRLDDEDWEVRQAAAEALGAVAVSDGAVRQALLARLADEDRDVRSAAAKALGAVVGNDEAVRQALLARLDDEDRDVRREATAALSAVAVSDEAVRQTFLERLDDEDWQVRRDATEALGAVAACDGAVRQALLARLDDESYPVRSTAAKALGAVAVSDEAVRQAFLARLECKDWIEWQEVAEALEPLVGSDGAVRQAFLARLDEHVASQIREKATKVLGSLVGSDDAVRQLLLSRLTDEHTGVRREAAEALGAAVGSNDAVRQALLARLTDESSYVRRATAKALGAVVGSDEAVRQALLARLDDKDWDVRAAAVMTLSEKSRAEDVPIESFIPWLGAVGFRQDLSEQVRRAVAQFVALEARHDERWLKRLLEMVRHPEWQTRRGAAIALLSIPGGPPPEAKSVLLGLLEDLRDEGSWDERLETVELLLNVRDREASEKAIDCAMRALDYGVQPWHDGLVSMDVRSKAAEILGRLEPTHRNERVLQRLLQLLREDDWADVRDTAYQAVLRLIAAPVERRGD
ncbi:NACHT domain-containing protein [Archangium minus]|uniref:NACHT domain-containing protein n=1 Tax=Archangium minus TaxID=83450 RepID=A0ABY9WVG4_9BACT|nr:NACHT domain-containing protein [Archangium minus]